MLIVRMLGAWSRLAATLAAAIVVLAIPLASGFHIEDVEPVAQETSHVPGWVVIPLTTDGTDVTVDGRIDGTGSHVGYGWALLDEEGNALYNRSVVGYTTPSGAHVDVRTEETGRIHESQHEQTGPGFRSVGWGFHLNEPGHHAIVMWTAGVLDTWTWTLSVDPNKTAGVEVHDPRRGTDTFMHTSSNFTGTANLQAYGLGLGVRAAWNTSLSEQIEGTLFGWYTKSGSPGHPNAANEMTVDLPNGSERSCPCHFGDPTGPYAPGPGEYTFHHAGGGVMAGFMPPPELIVAGADVQLPG